MQFGIIAFPSTQKNGEELVTMGLVDYQALPVTNTPNVVIEWRRREGKEFHTPKIVYINADVAQMGTTGKILKCLETLKKHFHDPANLLGIITKQLARQIVWDERVDDFVMTKRIKDEETRFEILVDGKAVKVLPADSEEDAIVKGIKALATAEPKVLAKFAVERTVRKLDSKEGAPPEFVPLSVYARRSAAK